jgi:parallel beta-helix repeat protein
MIENLRFSDGNEYAVKVQNTRDLRFIRCSFSNSNTGLYGLNNIAGTAVIKCSVENCYASGINLGDECPRFLLKENTVVNINTVPGAWRGGLAGSALEAVSDSGLIESNYISNCGYNGIGFRGNAVQVIKNTITNFCLIRHDGGAIYTFNANNLVVKDWLVANNIIQNGKGAGEGTPDPKWLPAQGIYADNNTNGGTIRDNRVTACNGAGIFIHNSYNLEIENNTLTDNATGIFLYQDGGIMRNHRLHNNRIVSRAGQKGLKSQSIVGSTENFFKK